MCVTLLLWRSSQIHVGRVRTGAGSGKPLLLSCQLREDLMLMLSQILAGGDASTSLVQQLSIDTRASSTAVDSGRICFEKKLDGSKE